MLLLLVDFGWRCGVGWGGLISFSRSEGGGVVVWWFSLVWSEGGIYIIYKHNKGRMVVVYFPPPYVPSRAPAGWPPPRAPAGRCACCTSTPRSTYMCIRGSCMNGVVARGVLVGALSLHPIHASSPHLHMDVPGGDEAEHVCEAPPLRPLLLQIFGGRAPVGTVEGPISYFFGRRVVHSFGYDI